MILSSNPIYRVHNQGEKIIALTPTPHGHGEKNSPYASKARVLTLVHYYTLFIMGLGFINPLGSVLI
jgi:hypothetical protein